MGIELLMKDKVDEEVGELISELTRLLKKLDKQTLDLILDDVLKSGMKMPKARKVVLDILPSVGTYQAVDVLLERIEKGDIQKQSASLALMTLSLLPKPDVFMVQRLMDYLEKRHSHPTLEDTMLCRSAWLTLGSLGDKMIQISAASIKERENERKVIKELQIESNDQQARKKMDMRLEKIDNKQHQMKELYTTAKDKIIKLVEKLHKRDDEDSQRLAVKVMANLRYEEFIPRLETIVKDNKKPEQVRIDALDSLRQMLEKSPEKVKKIFLPLSLDRKQPDVVRMIAISAVALTSRHSSPVEMIVRSLEDDPNDNVGHYVYTVLQQLSKLSTPCDGLKELALNSSLPKKYAKKWPNSHLKSSLYARSTYDEKLRIGHSYMSALLYSPKEWTPSYFTTKYTASLLGRTSEVVQVTYSGKGLDSVVDKLLMISSDTSLETVLRTILHPRQKRSTDTDYEHVIKDIKDKLGVKPKLMEELQGSIGLKVFGKELIYLDTSSLLSPLVQSGFDKKPVSLESLKDKLSLVESLKSLLMTQKTLVLPLLHTTIPTEMGLPLKLNIDKQASLKLDGEMKLKSDPRSSKRKSLIGKMDALTKVRPSGLLEIKCRMEVEMRHIRSGVSVKGKVYSDIPLTLSVNMDPDSSKLLIKLKDERELTLVKVKSHVHTELRRIPSTAEEFPLPPERKEIKIVDGADLKMVSYDIGKDILGRSVKILGMRSVRKDTLVPLPPMSGRQMIHVKYVPHVDTGLDLQIQHVTDSDLPKVDKDPSRKSSSWLSLGSWFSDSDSESDSSEDTSEESLSERDDAETFLDLELKDLTIKHLKNKFTKETEILKSGSKCGLVVRLADSNPEPKHQVQLSTLYQRDHSQRKVLYTVELKRMPDQSEEKPWKMVTDIRLDLPERNMEPSDLLDIEYQKQVQEQIKLTVTEDGKYLDSLLDIGTAVVTKAAKHLKKLYKPDSLDCVIEDSLNHVIQNSEGEDSKSLNDAVQQQRRILRDVTKLSRQPADPKKIKDQLETLKKLLRQYKSVTDKVSVKLRQTTKSDQKPEDSVKVLYIVVSKEKADKKLNKIVEKLRPLLLLRERKDLESKLRMHVLDLEWIKEHQRIHSMDKQSSELQKSRLEIEPEDRKLHSMLLDLEEKLITLSKKKSEDPKEKSSRSSIESRKKQIREIDDKSKDVRDKLDDTLLEKGMLDRMLRVKILEVLLHQKLMLLNIDKDTKLLEKKERTTDLRSFKTPDDNMDENLKKELVKLKVDLLRKSQAISRRLIVAINVEKERKSSDVHIQPVDEDKLVALVKVEVKHFKVLESLQAKDPSQMPDMRRLPSIESLERSMDEVKETNRQVMDLMDQELLDIKSERKPFFSTVLIKCLKSLSQQSVILERIIRVTKDKIMLEAVRGGPALVMLRKLKHESEQVRHDTIKSVLKIEQQLRKKDLPVPDTHLDDLSSLTSYLTKEKTSGVAVLLKKALKVEVQHSEVRPLQRKLLLSLDDPTPSDRLAKVAKNVHDKQLLYDIMSKLLSSQDELDRILKPLEQTLKLDHSSDMVKNLLQAVTEKLENQLKLVRTVEKKLIDKSHSDLSLLQPLQTIQQLKDRVQRQQHQTKLLQESSSSLPRDSPISHSSHHTMSLSKSVQPRKPRQHMYMGVVKVRYGLVDTDSKMISLRLFGRKSLQQLLWEQDQSLPSRQDPTLQRYLSDKRQPDDPTAIDYKTIKDKINTYRHLHVLLAYEESLPSYMRELTWKLHKLLKLKLHDKLELVMPDETNLKNQLEVKLELSSDDKLMDVEIKTPSETNRIQHIPTPDMVKRVSLLDNAEHTVLSALGSRLRPATCHVTPDRVKMLTEKTVEVDLRSHPCESVLTLDCSTDSSLSITSKPHPQDSSRKLLTILTKERKVEINPDPVKIEVKVDGKPISLPTLPSDTVRLYKDSPRPVVVRVIREDLMEVKLPHLGLSVLSDGKTISIKVPQTYWSKLCGICSSLDDKPEILRGPHQVQYSDPQPFVSTYLVPDSKCDPLPVQNSLGVPQLREKAKQVKPIEVTLVKETKRNGIHRTCFSISPVKKCPPTSTPHGIVDHLVHFYCLRSSSSRADSYRKIAHTRVLDEIKDKKTDMNENIPMPKYCSKP
ncbi:uncharacterized protein LOC132760118 isoform X2 [Ruditapes philippinarum]|uniref:uncharacterized protein LOC132760118 isoform X2 n=1 Tax=Ruditapes philippinarum TaxID=129788 RepID=UPI00295BBF69|nr:uncharacterized protein LOC132760118 isoform X2 [Ruditapes philippinarum]